MPLSRVVIFGGAGFIGTHLTQLILERDMETEIVLVDLLPPRTEHYASRLQAGLQEGRVKYIQGDVRRPLDAMRIGPADVVYNLAAILREPGHETAEYYETNLRGAEHVCGYATAVGCRQMVFTSSVSTYGPTEEPMDEGSLPVPETDYGSSKLVAEKMHMCWQLEQPGRRLLLIRPGIIYGAGEHGNMTRLVRSLAKGYYVYLSNEKTKKSGGYVKDLCEVFLFGIEHQKKTGEGYTLLNFSMFPVPDMQEYVETIRRVIGKTRRPFSIPRSVLMGCSYPVDAVSRLFGIKQPINPVRMRKLFRSTNIEAQGLHKLGYTYKFTTEEAFGDWKLDKPEDFQ